MWVCYVGVNLWGVVTLYGWFANKDRDGWIGFFLFFLRAVSASFRRFAFVYVRLRLRVLDVHVHALPPEPQRVLPGVEVDVYSVVALDGAAAVLHHAPAVPIHAQARLEGVPVGVRRDGA